MQSISKNEQETIVRWAADESRALISTSNPAIIRKLDRLTEIAPDEYRKDRDLTDAHDARYTMPVKLLRFAKPASEARRAAGKAMAERMRFTPKT